MTLPIQLGSSSGNPQGYNIQRSLRFRSSASAYLSRTPASAGNQQKYTFSCWIKRGNFATDVALFTARTGAAAAYTLFYWNQDRLQFLDSGGGNVLTTSVYRDLSAWYSVMCSVDTTQTTASDRVKIYVNGLQVTALTTANYPALNANTNVNTTASHIIGMHNSTQYFDGYLAEVNFIDGQALTPSSFGQTDPVTGAWVPKKYTGTYGTNGFYLDFKDNTSATTLAYDKSGNGNNWTPNNISTTAGATYDSMTDVPTLTSATAANYCVINPLDSSAAPTGGNLNVGAGGTCGTFAPSTGKWYAEYTCTNIAGGSVSNDHVGIINEVHTAAQRATTGFIGSLYRNDGTIFTDGGTVATSGASWGVNDVVGIAWDFTARTIQYYKNGVSQGTAVAMNSSVAGYMAWTWISVGWADTGAWNFGQRPFSYTPPTGFKALNTFNLPDPTIKKPNQYMQVDTFTGDATNYRQRSVGMKPDLVWVKNRAAVWDHILGDTVRLNAGNEPILLSSSNTSAEFANGYISSTDIWPSDGYAVNGDARVNGSGNGIVSWLWKESATAGFDIVTYTGNGTNGRTISHSLGVAPKMMIVKNRSSAESWGVYHASLPSAAYYLILNSTAAQDGAGGSIWNSTAPSSSVFTVGTSTYSNSNGANYVNYLFAEIAGFSKFGSYTGNGAAYPNGVFVYTGFRPRFLLIKMSGRAGTYWELRDTARSPYNSSTVRLDANNSNAEESSNQIDIMSNGFVVTGSDAGINGNGDTYIYAAFAENPFKYSNAR